MYEAKQGERDIVVGGRGAARGARVQESSLRWGNGREWGRLIDFGIPECLSVICGRDEERYVAGSPLACEFFIDLHCASCTMQVD